MGIMAWIRRRGSDDDNAGDRDTRWEVLRVYGR